MNIAKIKFFLKKHHIAPLKSLGQHFLINDATVKEIVRIANITKYDTIIEIGAGLGILTQELLVYAKKVIAIEIDKGFIDVLKERFKDIPNVSIIHADILKLQDLRFKTYDLRYKVVGNLPYNLASKILENFLRKEKKKPTLMVVTVQKEFAQRMIAKPPEMNRLALFVQYHGKPNIEAHFPPSYFWPQPKVHSSVVKIEVKKRSELPLEKAREESMWKIIKQAFSQPRKKLRNSIGLSIPKFQEKRPGELSLKKWIRIVGLT
ncbi:MAG: ribosomal RNA small subunit methyltransferase A [Candidatus Colwellbacteria bacterium]|nr:ribosomal RNA small subunit methyltransferase A [Candidatus Colwellbacteria bacterium]